MTLGMMSHGEVPELIEPKHAGNPIETLVRPVLSGVDQLGGVTAAVELILGVPRLVEYRAPSSTTLTTGWFGGST